MNCINSRINEINDLFGNIPEVLAGDKVMQNKFHEYDVLDHTKIVAKFSEIGARRLDDCSAMTLIISAWLHDIGKPVVVQSNGEYNGFASHQQVGARMVLDMPEKQFERFGVDKHLVAKMTAEHDYFIYLAKGLRKSDGSEYLTKLKEGIECFNDNFSLKEKKLLVPLSIADRLGQGVQGLSSNLECFSVIDRCIQGESALIDLVNTYWMGYHEINQIYRSI